MLAHGSQGRDSGRVLPLRRWLVGALAGCVAVGLVVAALWRHSPPSLPVPDVRETEPDTKVKDRTAASAGYVGPQACAPCHARRVADFHQTSHFRACRQPKTGGMPAGFSAGRENYTTRDPSLRFEMSQAGNDFLQTAIHTTATGEQRADAHIDLVYGASGADQIFFTWHGDRLFELPMAWIGPLDCWGNAPFDPYATGDRSRTTTPRCLECHNTWVGYVAGTVNQYRPHDFLMGVTCERCHGPGRDHVAYHQAHPEVHAARAIVHPGHLTRERQIEVCTQCHSNAIAFRRPPFSYRPGDPLVDCFRTNVSKHPENDHVANQIEYLRQSKCFQKSDTLTCITCHNPHRPSRPEQVRHACLKCHQPADCADQAHLPMPVRSNCVGCHMPQRIWMNVHFHTQDDQYVPAVRRYQHRIAVDPTARQEVLLAWYRSQSDEKSRQQAAQLTKVLVEYWLGEAEKRQKEFRSLAAIGAVREAFRVDPSPAVASRLHEAVAQRARLDAEWALGLHQIEEQRVPEAIDTLKRVLQLQPDMAAAHSKLGALYASVGKRDLAIPQLQKVAQCDANDPSGYMMLGWLAYTDARFKEAVQAYRQADAIEPFSAHVKYYLGLALAKVGQLPEAVASFRQALDIDPSHAGACQGLSHALRQQGQAVEALRYARRAAQLTRFENPDVLLSLADAYADAGRFDDAEATIRRALEAAQASNLQLLPQIRLRLENIRARRAQK
jgi:tetratricopeptide (TPR) repeat protein